MFVQFLLSTSIIQVGNENKIVILVFFHQEIKMQGIEELSRYSWRLLNHSTKMTFVPNIPK